MVEAVSTQALAQRCNLCWQEANGACFRTQCGHLFCESCAFQHFGQSQTCPTCGVSLEEADIADVTIGLAPTQFRRMVFQEIYKEPDFRSVGQSAVRAAMALHESLAFVLAQTTLEGQRAVESVGQMKAELAKQRHENGRLTMQMRNQNASVEQKLREADHKLRIREKELLDLQEAYKEKSRKCQAWEKAYGNLRSQTGRSRDGGGGFTPPESPRAGALRGPTGSYASMPQQRVSPRGNSSGVEGSSAQRPDERLRTNSPHSNVTNSGTFLGRSDQTGGGGGGGGGGSASWTMSRPTTSRGGGGGDHISPMLRPRQAQGFSHSVTPSPTFSTQPGTSSRFTSKRPETPQEVRAFYPRDSSPSHRASSGVGGGGGGGGGLSGGGGATSGVRGGYFPVSKSNSLF